MQGREKIAPAGVIQQKAAKSPVPSVQTGEDALRAHQFQPLFPAGKQNFPVFRRRPEKSSLFHDEMPAHQLHAVVHQTEGGRRIKQPPLPPETRQSFHAHQIHAEIPQTGILPASGGSGAFPPIMVQLVGKDQEPRSKSQQHQTEIQILSLAQSGNETQAVFFQQFSADQLVPHRSRATAPGRPPPEPFRFFLREKSG